MKYLLQLLLQKPLNQLLKVNVVKIMEDVLLVNVVVNMVSVVNPDDNFSISKGC